MLRHNRITSISLMLSCSIVSSSFVSSSFAYDDFSQNLSISSWSAATQFPASSLAINFPYKLDQNWFNEQPIVQSSLLHSDKLDTSHNVTNKWAIDFKHRLFSSRENTYLAMGLGWNDIEVEGETNSGMRFVAEGRVGIYGPSYLFGQAALSPWMTNSGSNLAPLGKELELGLAVNPLPSMSFRAGYRSYWLDYSGVSEEAITTSRTNGFYLGGGMNW